MKFICVTNKEAKLIHEHKTGVLVRLLKKQPPEGLTLMDKPPPLCAYRKDIAWFNNQDYHLGITISHPSGLYGVKETWLELMGFLGSNPIRYKADTDDSLLKLMLVTYKLDLSWRSPVTMPQDAIRYHIQIKTTIKRVQSITRQELRAMGYTLPLSPGDSPQGEECRDVSELHSWFMRDWNNIHAKPAFDGKSDEYVRYPYRMSGYYKWYDDRCYRFPYSDNPTTWKGKPLRTYYNPYVEIRSYERSE